MGVLRMPPFVVGGGRGTRWFNGNIGNIDEIM